MDNLLYRVLVAFTLSENHMSKAFWRLCDLLAKEGPKEFPSLLPTTDEDIQHIYERVSARRMSRSRSGESEDATLEATVCCEPVPLDVTSSSSNDFDVQTLKSSISNLSQDNAPMRFDDNSASIINFKPAEPLRITCLTIGSRGDVQPYISLCKGLLEEGHKPLIATHKEFEFWIRSHGIDFAPVAGDPAELMRICVEHGMFTYTFMVEARSKFRGWIDDLLITSWKACQNSDVLIESPSAMGGIHIAEALGIPYFRAFTMPWTKTAAYPHAFAVTERNIGGTYNKITYTLFDMLFWKAISGQVNRWRKTLLGLQPTSLDKMQPNKVPFLYNFSPSVVPPPVDYPEWVRVTGYWFLNEGSDFVPPDDLVAFIDKARADKKKLVYIGFGSIVVRDPVNLTKTVIDAVLKVGVRCILSKGWSDRLGDPENTKTEIELPPEIHQITSAPHDWLFSQVDAVMHHGGAGTTGASLRAGIPTVIRPFFGDQFFFGSRVRDLGVGVSMKKLDVEDFISALWEATNSQRMIIKAKQLGQRIRQEDGVGKAIQSVYRDLEYAKTLTFLRQRAAGIPPTTPMDDDESIEDFLEGIEESWTFIGDDMVSKARNTNDELKSLIEAAEALPPLEDDGEV
ncbi:Sterol 3-beta-glucosyltransferase [Arthroderma sp. PD_2]|nr:Sterol 3-beta-glucosyltransferase [Arthroderma sp. PD_2]